MVKFRGTDGVRNRRPRVPITPGVLLVLLITAIPTVSRLFSSRSFVDHRSDLYNWFVVGTKPLLPHHRDMMVPILVGTFLVPG